MPVTSISLLALTIAACLQAVPAQQPPLVAYPERDILSPFRNPTDLYAPSDELFRQLTIMQNLASHLEDKMSVDETGREVIDDDAWRSARAKVNEIGLNAGQLASIIRLHRNGQQRDTAFYGMFYVGNISHVMEMISHIPGEPNRRTREKAFPRAIQFIRAHLGRRFGALTKDEQATILAILPDVGSPAAKAQGLTRKPKDNDHLHELRLVPFLQLLDVDNDIDRAQALWFLKEVFKARPDMANLWLEPSLPRLQKLLISDQEKIHSEAVAIYQLIGPKDLPPPPSDSKALTQWAKQAASHMFPPIRNINDAIIQLFPSEERDMIAKAGIRALENSGIGDPFRGQMKDGKWYRGFRIGHLPEVLEQLAIPVDSVITSVNGASIFTAKELLRIASEFAKGKKPTRVFVEYVFKGKPRAVEYRIM